MTTTRGQHLIGKELGAYILERLLGYGGSSAVFLARHRNSDQLVAVKVFLPRGNMDKKMQKDFYTRFLREADAASKLHHPNILSIYSYGEQDGLPYIVMPYMSGGTLSEQIAKNGPFSLRESLWYLDQIASALDYAHKHNCVHCDVKPANILLDEEGRVVLSDFGIAHMMQTEEITGQVVTKAPEALMGTPDYISPEQAMGQPLDGRSDIYSLGITLFYLLAKQLPFKADTTIALALMHVHEYPPPLALLRLDVTPTIDHVVHKALAKKPEDRFQTAGEFSSAFAAAIEEAEASERMQKVGASNGGRRGGFASLSSNSEPQPLLIASSSVVRVKPLWYRSLAFSRLAMAVILVLALLTAAVVVTGNMFLRNANGANGNAHKNTLAQQRVVVSATSTPDAATVDQLINGDDWPVSSTFFYVDKQYHILNTSQKNVALALYAEHEYRNFHLSVTMQEVQSVSSGADYYGIVFRSTSDQSHFYLFEIVTSGANSGQYGFLRSDGSGLWNTIAGGFAPSLLTDPHKSNTLTIDAHNNSFSFTINKQSLGPAVSDPGKVPIMGGAIGLYVEDKGAEVVFSHLYITES